MKERIFPRNITKDKKSGKWWEIPQRIWRINSKKEELTKGKFKKSPMKECII